MNSLVEGIRPYLEAIYFLSSIVLAVGVIVSFQQLRQIKSSEVSREKRLRSESALKAIERYISSALPKNSAVTNLDKGKVPKVLERSNIIDFSIPLCGSNWILDEGYIDYLSLSVDVCNELEAVASCFVSGVADDDVGFTSIGRSFCFLTEKYSEIIGVSYTDDVHPHYQNVVNLYSDWNARLQAKKLDRDLERMHSKRLDLSKIIQRKAGR